MVFTEFFNFVFSPLVKLGPLYAIAGISLAISFVFSALYLVLVNQETMKRIKSEQKDMQQKMKNAQKSKDDKALKDLFSTSMQLQNRMMMLTIKPMIASMLVFFIMVPWLSGTYGDITVKLTDGRGELTYQNLSEKVVVSGNEKDTLVSIGEKGYASGDKAELAGKTWTVQYSKDKSNVVLQNMRFKLPFSFPLVGTEVGWLGIYIIISLPATMLFRKLLGVD